MNKERSEHNKISKASCFKWAVAIESILMLSWGAELKYCDAFYVNYLLIMVIAGICCFLNVKTGDVPFAKSKGRLPDVTINLFAVLFSIMNALANYLLWTDDSFIPKAYGVGFNGFYKAFMTFAFFVGGYLIFWNIFTAVYNNLERFFWKEGNRSSFRPGVIFAVTFTAITVTRLIILFGAHYPGDLTFDSITQLNQVMTGAYTNHHPIYHTFVIKLCVDLGIAIFNDINAGVAIYSVFQTLFTAMSFSFAASTMSMMKAPKRIVVMTVLFFVLMPYHVMYAITMWKDVMFGCFVLLLVAFVYRCLKDLGNKILNIVMLILSSIGTCVFRSNGFFVFVLFALAFVFMWRFGNKKILIVFASSILVSFLMKHAFLAGMDISQPDMVESLSIPIQQISRVVYEGNELTEEESELLGEIMDVDKIQETYLVYRVDPIKALIHQTGDVEVLSERKADFLKLYLSMGVKYPMVYARAWIDETRGFWNAGYAYWRWTENVEPNDLGVVRTTQSEALNKGLSEYLWLSKTVPVVQLFLSIGLFVWIDMLMLMIAILRKDRIGALVALPVILIVLSLMIATPVYAEFRYIYAAFCTLPMTIVIALRPIGATKKENVNG